MYKTKSLLGICLAFVTVLVLALALVATIPSASQITAEASSEPQPLDVGVLNPNDFVFEYVALTGNNALTYNGKQQYFSVKVTAFGSEYIDYTITYKLVGSSEEPTETAPINAGTYDVKITINEDTAIYKESRMEILPKPIELRLSGANEFIYENREYSLNVSALGAVGMDDIGLELTYVGNKYALEVGALPVDADTYTLQAVCTNPNYKFGGFTGSTVNELEITKGTLTAKAKDVTIKLGETPTFEVEVVGFAEGDDNTCIKSMPTVNFGGYDTVGKFSHVKPSGGFADNYNFVYQESTLTVNKLEAQSAVQGTSSNLSVKGVFNHNFEFDARFVEIKSDEGKKMIESVEERGMLIIIDDIEYIYDMNVKAGDAVSDLVEIKIDNVTLDRYYNYSIIVVNEAGIATEITKYNYKDGILTFNSYDVGTIYVVCEKFEFIVWVVGGCVGIVVIILFVIFTRIKYLSEKRQIDAQNKQKKRNKKETLRVR